MIISKSFVGMESARSYTSVSMDASLQGAASGTITNFLDAVNKAKSEDLPSESGEGESPEDMESALSSYNDIMEKFRSSRIENLLASKTENDAMMRIRVQCVQFLLFLLFGSKLPKEDNAILVPVNDYASSSGNFEASLPVNHRVHYYSEEESTTYRTEGKVITADGREIDFNLDFSLSREFEEYYEENVNLPISFTDPLVINLDSDVASVSDVKIHFDLDSDGSAEEISNLSSSSGFLAIDMNEDGIINDGSELFGAASGNGFMDLSQYDEDQNGWIDEADSVFNKLLILTLDENGNQTLYKLSDKNVGALNTGSVSTQFSLNNPSSNITDAVIRRSGVFLYENGLAGTLQQLDWAVGASSLALQG